jgi:hypothetical protein
MLEFLLLNTLARYCFWVGFADDYGDYGDFWDFSFRAVLIGVFFVGDSLQIIPCGMGELDVARFARVFDTEFNEYTEYVGVSLAQYSCSILFFGRLRR